MLKVLKTAPKASKKPSKRGSKPAKGKRSPKGCSRQPSEHELHLHAWQWVCEAHPQLLIFHVPNGGSRNIAEAMKFKRMGVLPGVADFLVFKGTKKVAIELKNNDGTQSDDQKKFAHRWFIEDGQYYVCRELEDFKTLINAIVMF